MIGKYIHEYRVLSDLGEGGMGVVYLAEHPRHGLFAIKALAPQLVNNPKFKKRFFKEVKTQFSLSHSNVVQPHTLLNDEDDNLYLVMEYVDGDALDVQLDNDGALPEETALAIFKDVLIGLNYAHTKGVIHRDIKPSNILLTQEGRAKIVDFGIALTAEGRRLTKTGTTMGTAWYMSPEQITQPKSIDHRSDVYAMGVILYEMLTGQVPFDGEADFEIYKKHIEVPPPDLNEVAPDISPILNGIIHKAMEKKPDDRFDGCAQFLDYIQAYEEEMEKERQSDEISDNEVTESNTAKYLFFFIIICLLLFLLFNA